MWLNLMEGIIREMLTFIPRLFIYCLFRNAYKSVKEDILWFGKRSIEPATLLLKEKGSK
jgi:hypothetical protein